MSTPRKKALFLLITRMRIFLLRGGTYRAFFKVNRLKYYKVVGKWGKAFKEVKSPMTRWHSFTWDFFRLLPYIFIGKQPTEKKHGWNCDGEWGMGGGFSFSGAQISLLLSHKSGFCDRNRGSFHGLSQTRGVVATNEMKNTIIYWQPPILAISLQRQTKNKTDY